jgi:hypothetical protein
MEEIMNKRKFVVATCVVASIGMLYGCSANTGRELPTSTEKTNVEVTTSKDELEEIVSANPGVTGKLVKVLEETNTLEELPEGIKAEKEDVPIIQLPDGIEGMKAETEAYPDLESLIIQYYDIPDDFLDQTSYYYNYVDLNDDGSNEIFVVVSGPYTSGTGGNSALWVVENGGQLHVNQDFTLVNTPVIISDKITNGVHELVIPYYGGGAESQYKILTCSDGFYSAINDSQSVETLEGITGKSIIANDLIKEIENGKEALKLKVN